jgi:TPR repeat protein
MSRAASKVLKCGLVVLGAALVLAGCATINVSIAKRMAEEGEKYRAEALRLYQEGSYKESVDESTKSLERFKQSVELCASEPNCEQYTDEHVIYSSLYALRAMAYTGAEDYQAALKDARAAVDEKADNPFAHQALAFVLLAAGDREAARAEVPKAKPMSADMEQNLDYLFKLPSAAEAAQALKKQFYDRTPFARALAAYNAQNYTLAMELWLPLAQKGDAAAQYNVALMYRQGQGTTKDEAKAFEWYLRAAKQGDQLSMAQVGESYRLGTGVKKNAQEAVKWLQAAAEKGAASAAYSLGMMYYEGQDVAKDEQAALRWIRQAADAGDSNGQVMLGYMYENGLGVGSDPVKAVELYRKAAEQKNSVGQYNLGVMYANGIGVKKDEAEAASWYRSSAENGYQDGVTALKGLAEEGSAPAQYELASLFLEGKAVPQDDKQAVELLARSANGGYAPAQETLGELYLEGKRGLAQDAAHGERLLLAAADQGLSGPKLLLANLYATGEGSVKKDPVKAYMWYELVIQEGDQTEDLPEWLMSLFDISSNNTSKWLDATLAQEELKKSMTKAQVSEALRRAAQWEKQHPKPKI